MAYTDNEKNDDRVQLNKHRRSKVRNRRLLMAAWALLLVIVAYFAIQVVIVLTPNLRMETALLESMTDSITVNGIVALESEPVYYSGGVLYYTVPSGERVSGGTAVAEVYGSEASAAARGKVDELEAQIDQVKTASNALIYSGDMENYSRQLNNTIMGMLDAMDTGDYTGLQDVLGGVALANNKLLMATGEADGFGVLQAQLESQLESYRAQAVAQNVIEATDSGYFVIASGRDRIPKSYEMLAQASPAELDGLLAQPAEYYGSNVAGYIISDYKWHFFAMVDAQQATRFIEGKMLDITFASMSGSVLPVKVEKVTMDEATGLAKVELYCEYMSAELLKMQNETVEIIFNTHKGLLVSRDALRIVNDVRGVYVEIGGVVVFTPIEILIEDDNYMLVQRADQSETSMLNQYDEVIVDSGGAELYDGRILSGYR